MSFPLSEGGLRTIAKRAKSVVILNTIVDYVELLVSILLIIALLYLVIQLGTSLYWGALIYDNLDFDSFITNAFNLVIGVELVRMLCRHTPDTIIDVLLFTTARHLVISHNGALDSLLGALAIGALFLIRRYVLAKKVDEH